MLCNEDILKVMDDGNYTMQTKFIGNVTHVQTKKHGQLIGIIEQLTSSIIKINQCGKTYTVERQDLL